MIEGLSSEKVTTDSGPEPVRIKERLLRLDIRKAVAVRRIYSNCTLLYLSVFDDEIDLRLDAFMSNKLPNEWSYSSLARCAQYMEPTDAIVIVSGRQVLVARGGACSFPLYWKVSEDFVVLSTVLPIDSNRCLSLSGLLSAVAVVAVTYQNEPNLVLSAPLPGWFRCRRGAVSLLKPGAGRVLAECPIDLAFIDESEPDRGRLIESVRLALDKFGRRQRSQNACVIELSGGFDSTMAAIAARNHDVELYGVSVHFPYYEFRFEDDLQVAVSDALQISRMRLDGTRLFAYAPPEWWPRLDEPATVVIGLKRDLAIARLAQGWGVNRVLVGQGGDQLFSEDMLEPVPPAVPLSREAFSRSAWETIECVRKDMQSAKYYLRRSTLTYLHDARMDMAMKESFGIHTRSPFSDIDMIRCGVAWAKQSAKSGIREGKKILTEAFEAEFPYVVANRKSKVSWDGVCARSYALHGKAIAAELEHEGMVLEHIGIDVAWLIKRVGELARWEKTTFGQDDKEIFAVYALATWLHSWGVEHVSDCGWEN